MSEKSVGERAEELDWNYQKRLEEDRKRRAGERHDLFFGFVLFFFGVATIALHWLNYGFEAITPVEIIVLLAGLGLVFFGVAVIDDVFRRKLKEMDGKR